MHQKFDNSRTSVYFDPAECSEKFDVQVSVSYKSSVMHNDASRTYITL